MVGVIIQKSLGLIDKRHLTLSSYTREAEEYAKNIDSKIILINGDQLAQYMIETNSGVETEFTYFIKRINMYFFE